MYLKQQLNEATVRYGEVVNDIFYRYQMQSPYDAIHAAMLCAGGFYTR
jgi:hypothetical protein